MFTWAQVVLAFLKIASVLLEEGQKRKWIAEGENKAIVKGLLEITRKSDYGKRALEEFTGMSDTDIDDFLRSLEPGQPSNDSR